MSKLIHITDLPEFSIMAFRADKYETPIDIYLTNHGSGGDPLLKVEMSLTLEQAQALRHALGEAVETSLEIAQSRQMAAAHAERPE